ncbi:unannotated protein [freshwater metagenome]|uniref:Unannotated protein n=1 Tax=freshwater metagenome TaxID=449393 RepID=A0A6J7ULU8_9ZZZZ
MLRKTGNIAIAIVDGIKVVFWGIKQVAARHLGMRGSRVEQSGRGRQIVERRDELVELDCLFWGGGETTGHAQQEVLRGLDHAASLWVAQEVPVIDRAQTEELIEPVALRENRVIELASVSSHHCGGFGADDALSATECD